MKRKILTIMLVLIPCLCFADSESTIGGRTAKSHIIQDEGVSLRPRAYLNVSGDTVQAYEDSGKTILYSDAINEATADTIYLRLDTANDPLTGELSTSQGTISSTIPLTLGSAEHIHLDSAYWIDLDSASPTPIVTFKDTGTAGLSITPNIDDVQALLSTVDATGNSLIIGTQANYVRDYDHAVQTNPTLFIHSDKSPDTDNTEYISLYHDQTYGVIASGSGAIKIITAGNSVNVFPLSTNIINLQFLEDGGTAIFRLRGQGDQNQMIVGVTDNAGNQMILTNDSNATKDHDHATTTNPTLFIHSDKSPDTDNTEYMSFYHDQTDANIDVGSGDLNLNPGGTTITGDGGTTNYAQFAADGELTLIGTARIKRTRWIGAAGIKAPGAKPATFVLHGITGAWQFADQAVEGNQETVSGTFKIPNDMDKTVAPEFNIGWSADGISPGNAEWQFEYLWLTGNEDTTAVSQETLTVISTASSTSNGLVVACVTGIDVAGATDKAMFWKITRLSAAGSNDTIVDTTEMHGNFMEYTSNSLGTAL